MVNNGGGVEQKADLELLARDRRGSVVAIDGPAGAGKSTVAAHLATVFGLLNLETGAMYRALALKVLRAGVALEDAEALESMCSSTSMRLEPGQVGNRVLLDSVDVTGELRAPEVTAAASRVSVHPAVRTWMVREQREMGVQAASGVVMEGRDIGTVVFPDATVKIFLDASVEARGERRFEQQGTAATGSGESRERITDEIAARDSRDRNREVSPLRPAADAVVIDTTGMALDAVLARATALVATALHAG